ncbi:Cytochrome oxidase assembly [Naganishia albida]|nr:Cytochrome oxidase assembly [Naganishia albida]
MAVFGSQPLNPTPFQRAVKTRLQRRPFMYFGLPFIGLVIFSSYALESFTKTRYDYQSTKVQSVTKEEQLRMDKNRKRVDLKEEYYRLQGLNSEKNVDDDWENVRVPRPAGVPEWGTNTTINADELKALRSTSRNTTSSSSKPEERLV